MHFVGRCFEKEVLDAVRSDLAAKGVTEADVDTREPLEGQVKSEWTLCVCELQ